MFVRADALLVCLTIKNSLEPVFNCEANQHCISPHQHVLLCASLQS